jgi:cytochrome b6
MFSTYFMKAYRRPRELTWVSGVLLFFLMLGFGFSGYLLPWNELAFFATQVGTDIVGAIPLIGQQATIFLRGSEQVTGATLSRFFGLHVAILPALTSLLLLFHLGLVQKHGMSIPPRSQDQQLKTLRFFPNVFLRDLVAWYIMLALLVVLCAFYPWELGIKADPFAPAPIGIQPEWFFLFMFQTLKYIPSHVLGVEGETVGVLAFGLGAVLWLCVPLLDFFLVRFRLGRLIEIMGVFLVVYIVALTLLAVW